MLFRKRRPNPSTPPWLKWVVIAFIVMAVATNLRPGNKTLENASQALNPKALLHTDDIATRILPTSEGALRVQDLEQGHGVPAICGQEVKIEYHTEEEKENQPLTFRIGSHSVMPALEQGVVGMKEGGKRGIFAPASLSANKKPEHFEVTLEQASPALPDPAEVHYRIIPGGSAVGKLLLCGEPASVQVTMWSVEGKKLFSTKGSGDEPITFTPGKSQVPLGLEQGIVGMPAAGTRVLIIPPEYQKTMNGTPSIVDFPFPKNQTVLVDVEGIPAERRSSVPENKKD